jgi:stearoyl-CoA desaturase (delta-9 desaturase)
MGWMFFKDPPEHRLSIPKDLKDDPIVQWQDRYYLPLALTVCFGIPTLFGYFVGNPIGGLLIGGVMRVFLSSHATFLINSAAHTFGKPTYSNQLTAKDNPLLAFFTCGEGFHNFHHKFQNDYRNGIRWFHWDPTKWGINFFAKLGLAKNLRITPEEKILLSQLQVEQENLQAKGANCEKLNFLQNAILQLQDEKRNLIKKLEELRRNQSEYSQIIYNELQKKIIECQKSLKNSYQEWMKEKKYLLSHLSVTH